MRYPKTESLGFFLGVLPPMVSAIFGILLPIVIRRLTKYQGAVSAAFSLS